MLVLMHNELNINVVLEKKQGGIMVKPKTLVDGVSSLTAPPIALTDKTS